jgi:spermidine synthase
VVTGRPLPDDADRREEPMPGSRRARVPPPLMAALALGVVAQVGQVVFLRELLMVYYGSEFSIGIILASWMAWVGIGSRLGGANAWRVRRPVVVLAALSGAVLLILPATILVVRVLRGFFPVLPGEHLSLPATVWSSVLVMAPGCLLLGMHFVLVSRIWREGTGASGVGAAGERGGAVGAATRTYVFEAAGNATGGALFSLLLVHFLNSFQVAVLAGVLLPAAVVLVRGWGVVVPRRLLAGLFGAGLLVVLVVLPPLDGLAYRLQWQVFAPDHQLVETRQSKYGVISVARRGGQYSFFQSGHLAFAAGATDEAGYELEESAAAVFAHFAMVQHPGPRRVLLMGGGMSGVLREVARHPVAAIDYVELDRVLVEAALDYVPRATREVLESSRVRLVTMDGRRFVRSARGLYDLVIVDVPDPATAVLNRFYTVEFFDAVSRVMEPDGVLVTGIGATADLRSRVLANRNATVYHTLDRVFEDVVAVGDRFAFFFASNGPGQISTDPVELRRRYLDRGIRVEGFSEGYFFTLLQDAPLRRLNWVLRHHGRETDAHLSPPRSPPLFPGSLAEQAVEAASLPPVVEAYFINSDLRPVGYYHTVVLWHTLTRPGQTPLFDRFLTVRPGWLLPPVAAALALQLVLRATARRPGRRHDAAFGLRAAILTTGFSIMALQIAVLFSFQSVYGFVYEMVGLILALFMAGLALGAWLTHRLAGARADRRGLAAVQLLVALYAGAAALALPLAAGAGSSWVTFVLFSVLTFTGGLLNGAGFPLAVACCMGLGSPADRATGTVYGNELIGACAGALLAGVVVAPILGVVACCLMAGILNAGAFGLILLGRESSWSLGAGETVS